MVVRDLQLAVRPLGRPEQRRLRARAGLRLGGRQIGRPVRGAGARAEALVLLVLHEQVERLALAVDQDRAEAADLAGLHLAPRRGCRERCRGHGQDGQDGGDTRKTRLDVQDSPLVEVLTNDLTAMFSEWLGAEDTKVEILSVLCAGRNLLLEGPVGSGKTLLAEQIAAALPDVRLAGCSFHCLPGERACPQCRSGMADSDTRVVHGRQRFVRIQGSPDLFPEDLIGDVDPAAALQFGILDPRAFRPGRLALRPYLVTAPSVVAHPALSPAASRRPYGSAIYRTVIRPTMPCCSSGMLK